MTYIQLCLLKLKQHVTNEKKHENISKMLKLCIAGTKCSRFLAHSYLYLLAIFYDLSERGQFYNEQNQSLTNIDTNPIHLLFSMC